MSLFLGTVGALPPWKLLLTIDDILWEAGVTAVPFFSSGPPHSYISASAGIASTRAAFGRDHEHFINDGA